MYLLILSKFAAEKPPKQSILNLSNNFEAIAGPSKRRRIELPHTEVNSAAPSKKSTETPKKMVECPICQQKFAEVVVTEHASNCVVPSELTSDSEESRDTLKIPAATKKRAKNKFVCEVCTMSFTRLSAFTNHKCKG